MGPARTLLLLGLASLAFLVGQAAPKDSDETESRGMPVKIYAGYLIVVEGSIAGLHRLNFLLDTGASNSAIDCRLADRLELPRRLAKLINFDKAVSVEWSELPELDYGPEHVANVRLMIEDLSYLRAEGVRLDGLIGLDLLRRENFLVDYARKRVVFGAKGSEGMHAVPMGVDSISLRVGVELDGRPAAMILDTGSPGAVFYRDRLEAMLVNYKRGERTVARSFGGAVDSQVALIPRLRLGGQDLNREVVLVRSPGDSMIADVAGYLGLASLEARQIAFDFEKNEFLWKK